MQEWFLMYVCQDFGSDDKNQFRNYFSEFLPMVKRKNIVEFNMFDTGEIYS